MPRTFSRTKLATLLCLTMFVIAAPAQPAVASQPAPGDQAVEVGVALDETAFTFLGKSERRGQGISFYGYLPTIAGLEPTQLFVDPSAASPATARFNYFGRVELGPVTAVDGVEVTEATGTMTFYFKENGGGNFDAPESFFGGVAIAEFEVRLRDLYSPEFSGAPATSLGAFTQVSAEPFSLDGATYQVGRAGMGVAFANVGSEAPDLTTEAKLVIVGAGHGMISSLNGAPSPAPDIEVAADDCAGIESWLTDAFDRVDRRLALDDEVLAGRTIQTIDVALLSSYADEFAAFAPDQLLADVPAPAQASNDLLVSAFDTYQSALAFMVTAVETQNEESFDDALDLLFDGDDAIVLAIIEMEAIATACDVTL